MFPATKDFDSGGNFCSCPESSIVVIQEYQAASTCSSAAVDSSAFAATYFAREALMELGTANHANCWDMKTNQFRRVDLYGFEFDLQTLAFQSKNESPNEEQGLLASQRSYSSH